MEVYYPATSPLFALLPCKACSPGWIAEPDYLGVASNGSSYGWIATGQQASIELDFTGSAISFDLAFAPNTPSSAWSTALSINGTETGTGVSAKDLPVGEHAVKLDLGSNSTSKDEWIRFDGATIELGSLVVAGTQNGTVDDSAWRDWKVLLSPGWNMLETNESNWINGMDEARGHADSYWSQSLSWTEQAGANTTILFNGSAFWARFEVILDNSTMGVFNASAGPAAYQSLLYSAAELEDTDHTLTLVNVDAGRRLSFDRLEHVSGLLQKPATTPTTSPHPSETTSAAAPKGLSTGAIAGIAAGAGALVIALTLWALLAWTGCGACLSRKVRKNQDGADILDKPPPRASFWRWSTGTGFTAPTRPLRPSHAPPTTSFGPFVQLEEKPMTTFLPTLGTMTRQLTIDTSPPDSPANQVQPRDTRHARTPSDNPLGTSFLRLSRSTKKPDAPFNWSHAPTMVPVSNGHDDDEQPGRRRKPTALWAAVTDSTSPLTSLHDSFIPNLGPSRSEKDQRNRSISIKTALDDEAERPVTPGGILDGYMATPSDVAFGRASGYILGAGAGGTQLQAQQAARTRGSVPDWDNEESTYPSIGERNPRRLLGRILGERPLSGSSIEFRAV